MRLYLLLLLSLLLLASLPSTVLSYDAQDVFDFLEAAARGDVAAVAAHLDDEPKLINAKDPTTGATALIVAADKDHPELVEYLIQRPGVDSHETENGGYYVWDVVAFKGLEDIATVLLQHGVSPNKEHKDGFRPIHRVCWGTTDEHARTLARMLASKLVGPNDLAGDGSTPLSTALDVGKYPPVIRVLIGAGADVSKLSAEERHVHFDAIQQAKSKGVKVVEAVEPPQIEDKDEELLSGVLRGDLNMVRNALGRGADMNRVNPHEDQGKNTPLMAATLAGHVEIVRELLKRGADATIGEMNGYTPFHGAAFNAHTEIGKVLLEFGLDPNHMHEDGYQPIHRVCWVKGTKGPDFMKVLLESKKVSPDAKSKDGKTPLQLLAATSKNFLTARVLVEAGADASVLTNMEREQLQLIAGVEIQVSEKPTDGECEALGDDSSSAAVEKVKEGQGVESLESEKMESGSSTDR